MTKKNSSTTLFLSQFLPYRLSVLSNRISRAIADQYEEQFQLSLAEWRVMAVLGEENGLSAGQVAKRTAMDKVAVSRAVGKLLDADRIVRYFSEKDRRRSILSLSESGHEIYSHIVPIALEYEKKLMEQLAPEEQELLDALLEKLQDIQLHA
ncbi:MAG: MarR family winged helix-turn-helix transcriptional regulator [Kordiimonas sp.]